jgi:outer membrane protein OmpA-like peptidoglycan-associated protein
MNENPAYLLEINGHTDNIGDKSFNTDLSQRRANAVKAYLISKGIKSERLTAKGYGDSQPAADNKTSAGRAKNRRVEFKINF